MRPNASRTSHENSFPRSRGTDGRGTPRRDWAQWRQFSTRHWAPRGPGCPAWAGRALRWSIEHILARQQSNRRVPFQGVRSLIYIAERRRRQLRERVTRHERASSQRAGPGLFDQPSRLSGCECRRGGRDIAHTRRRSGGAGCSRGESIGGSAQAQAGTDGRRSVDPQSGNVAQRGPGSHSPFCLGERHPIRGHGPELRFRARDRALAAGHA